MESLAENPIYQFFWGNEWDPCHKPVPRVIIPDLKLIMSGTTRNPEVRRNGPNFDDIKQMILPERGDYEQGVCSVRLCDPEMGLEEGFKAEKMNSIDWFVMEASLIRGEDRDRIRRFIMNNPTTLERFTYLVRKVVPWLRQDPYLLEGYLRRSKS